MSCREYMSIWITRLEVAAEDPCAVRAGGGCVIGRVSCIFAEAVKYMCINYLA
jgi:hypothetical protein